MKSLKCSRIIRQKLIRCFMLAKTYRVNNKNCNEFLKNDLTDLIS